MKIITENTRRTFETALDELARFQFPIKEHKPAVATYLGMGFSVELSTLRKNGKLMVQDWHTLRRTGKLISNQ